MDAVKRKYTTLCQTKSDINEHLPTLYTYATQCERILELGVRGCVSSWAFAYGLLTNNKSVKKIVLNDVVPCNIQELLATLRGQPIQVVQAWVDDLKLTLEEPVDMTFIDTWHVYGQMKRELARFSPQTKKYIILHDTTLDAELGESIRSKHNLAARSAASGISVAEIAKGLWPAVTEFLAANPAWVLKERYTNNNGLTILERVGNSGT
jgi:hypothetical protein